MLSTPIAQVPQGEFTASDHIASVVMHLDNTLCSCQSPMKEYHTLVVASLHSSKSAKLLY